MEITRRVAILLLRDMSGKVLLQHRDAKAPIYPAVWSFFGGEIGNAETPKQTLVRESREGLGLDIKDPKFFRRYELPYKGSEYHEIFAFVSTTDKTRDDLRKGQKDGDDLGFFGIEDITTMMVSENVPLILRDLFGLSEKEGLLEVEKG
jgi:8-oxo-dGTP pyrophosphatase MutT (NUDIX family)